MSHAESATNAEAIRRQLECVLTSRVFFPAQRSQAFLRYVVEKALLGLTPKEYEIAIDIFQRSADYDPAIDSTVRVEASRLRNRLREYYDTQGKHDPILIEIPKGGYSAVFTQLSDESGGNPDDSPALAAGLRGSEPTPAAAERSRGNGAHGSWPEPEDTPKSALNPAPRSRRRRALVWVSLLAAFSCAAFYSIGSHIRWERTRVPIRSIAVLALQNLSGDPSQDYFAAGMTDELTTELARIHGLRVVSRTSAVLASRSQKSLPQIAGMLNVDAVVEGSVSRSGNKIRITAQLIDARTDRHLWAQSFEGEAKDILSLQDTVADEIAAQTRVTLLPPSRTGNSERSIDPAAHDAFLRGLFFFEKQDFDHSVVYFNQAISIDPSYADAYVGLSTALDGQSTFQRTRPDAVMQQAMAAAQRAVRLDPNNGEAYIELGSIQTIYTWNWLAAKENLLRGIALSPNYALGEMKYSVYLDAVGRPQEAVDHMRRALDLDPMSFFMTRRLGATLYLARQYRQALDQLREAEQMEPEQNISFANWMSAAYVMQNRPAQAVQEDLSALHSAKPEMNIGALDRVYRHAGWKAYWRARIDELGPYADDQCMPYTLAISEVHVGDVGRAFTLLNRAVDQRCYAVIYFKTEPQLDPIRSDPRFAALLGRINLD